jgi:hypothetical protein
MWKELLLVLDATKIHLFYEKPYLLLDKGVMLFLLKNLSSRMKCQ